MPDSYEPLRGFKGQIHDPRAILRKEHEEQGAARQGKIQLGLEVPQRLVGLEQRVASMESKMDETLAEFRAAIEMLQNQNPSEPKRHGGGWPLGKPRKPVEPTEPEPEG